MDAWSQQITSKAGWDERLSRRPPGLLWHYTSLPTFDTILESGEMRATELYKLGDYREGRWILSSLNTYWPYRNSLVYYEILQDFPLYGSGSGPAIYATSAEPRLAPIFSLSLSGDGDLLSQWHKYADRDRGVAIGFDLNAVSNLFAANWSEMHEKLLLSEVTYDTNEHRIIIDELQNLWIQAEKGAAEEAEVAKSTGSRAAYQAPFARVAAKVKDALRSLEPHVKNPLFREEKEWRVIKYMSPGNVEDIKFRVKTDDIVRCCRIDLLKCLRHVRLGPLCKAEIATMRSFLNDRGRSDLSVDRSKATLTA